MSKLCSTRVGILGQQIVMQLLLQVSGVTVKLKPQFDPKSKEEVLTEIFASWGRKVEEQTPVPLRRT